MENKEYFTPDIEDLHIGYELEAKVTNYPDKNNWIPMTLQGFTKVQEYYEKGIYRVPYLNKEQIEAEGWKVDYTLGDFDYYVKTVNDEEYELEFFYKERININIWKRTLYHGECKDINTFRKICKLLGI